MEMVAKSLFSEFLVQEAPHSPNSSIVTHQRCSGPTGCEELLWHVLKKRTAKELNETEWSSLYNHFWFLYLLSTSSLLIWWGFFFFFFVGQSFKNETDIERWVLKLEFWWCIGQGDEDSKLILKNLSTDYVPEFILNSWKWQTYTCVFSYCGYPTVTVHQGVCFFFFSVTLGDHGSSLLHQISIRVN